MTGTANASMETSSAGERDRAGDGGRHDMSVMVMTKPALHLLTLSCLPPKERVLALAKLLEQLTGRKPTPEELEQELRTTQAAGPAGEPPRPSGPAPGAAGSKAPRAVWRARP